MIEPYAMRHIKLAFFCLFIVSLSACSRLIFHPLKEHVRTPDMMGLSYEDVYVETHDHIRLHGWLLPSRTKMKGSVYFLHGNAENISTHIQSVFWLPEFGYQVFLIDYRGYGLSEGKPGLPDVLKDVEAGFEWLLSRSEGKPVYLLGQSLGASLAVYFAANSHHARQNLTGVVSDAAFTGYFQISRDVADKVWITWPFQYPIAWMMDYPYNPVEVIGQVSPVPILISHGRNDQIVPFEHGEQLYQAAGQPKFFLVTEGRHIQTFSSTQNRRALLDFFYRTDEFALKRDSTESDWVAAD